METLKRPLVVATTLIAMSILLSWTIFEDYLGASNLSSSLSSSNMFKDGALSGYVKGNEISQTANQHPTAEDVLVKRIPGDNGHLLIMAYYSKENYSGPSLTIENGNTITLRDDGKGDDKVAGDGLYTAKIPADIGAFRSQALSLSQKMKASEYAPIRYLDRQRIVDPDAGESFELAKFDANEPVSISGLTNALSAASLSTSGASSATPPSLEAIEKNSVFITDISVVEDLTRTWNFKDQIGNINGPWSFKTLIRNLASKNSAQVVTDAGVSEFTLKWLKQFSTVQTVNGDVVAARPIANAILIAPWLARSKAAGAPDGQLDFRFAPFKLTAITNRFDLRDGEAFGNPGQSCGEARFTFTLVSSIDTVFVDPDPAPPNTSFNIRIGDPLRMTVILESRVNKKNSCDSKRDWAQQWVNLANLTLPSSLYNAALQKITDQFAATGNTPNSPNQNSLSQLRTNEIALEDLRFGVGLWQLREFNLVNNGNTQSNGKGKVDLKMGTDKMAPADQFNGTQRLADFVNQNTNAINSGFYSVPNTYQGAPFLGAVSIINGFPVGGLIPNQNGFIWNSASITNDNARFNISMQVCSGCHAGESQTFFTHIDNVGFGTKATVSGFVSGRRGFLARDADGNDNDGVFSVKDPAGRPNGNPTVRTFNEINRRAKDLLNVINSSCGTPLAISSELLFKPSSSVH